MYKKLSILCSLLAIFFVYTFSDAQLLKRENFSERKTRELNSPIIKLLDDAIQLAEEYIEKNPQYKLLGFSNIATRGKFESYIFLLEKDTTPYIMFISARGNVFPPKELIKYEPDKAIE